MHKGGPMLCNKSFGGAGKHIYLLFILILLIGANACSKATSASEESKNANFLMDPFILNLANHGDSKFLKVSIALELANASFMEPAKAKQAPLRDAIIALISSKSADEFLSPEGKMQFKDEILLTMNQILNKEGAVKNVYFTELIMQ